MTQVQFTSEVRSTVNRLRRMATESSAEVRERWMRALVLASTKENRRAARAATGKIYCREYTVRAHWRAG